jgi:hypothetical protein
MVWTVRYRDGNGEFREEAFEAASRSALFDMLAKRGISATRVAEGAPRAARRKPVGTAKAVAAVAGAALVAAAVVAFLFVSRGRGGDGKGKGGETATTTKAVAGKPTAGGGETVVKRDASRGKPLPRTRKDIAPPAPLEDILAEAAGKQSEGEDGKEAPKKPMFRPGTEQIISMAIPSEPGAGVPPIPFPDGADFSEDVKKSMQTAIEAAEGDDEATLERKIQVAEHKQELGELVKEGWTLQEYANAIREKYLLANDFLAECHEVVERAYADPEISDEAYIAMRDGVNAKLREQGLPEITSIEEQLAEESGDGGRSEDKR